MKRKRISKIVLGIAISLAIIGMAGFYKLRSVEAGPATVESAGYCESIAAPACEELASSIIDECMAEGGSGPWCFCRYFRLYNGCMEQFGCPGKDEQMLVVVGGNCPKIQ